MPNLRSLLLVFLPVRASDASADALLTFDQVEDLEMRERFNSMPATFRLKADEVDALIAQSKALLALSPEFNEFLRRVDRPVPDR